MTNSAVITCSSTPAAVHVNERSGLPFPHFSSHYARKHGSYYDNQGLFFPPSPFSLKVLSAVRKMFDSERAN